MMKDLPVEEKLELVRKGLFKLPAFKTMSYEFVGETKFNSRLAGDSYDFDFVSLKAERKVNFHFSPLGERHGDLLGVIIENKANNQRFALGDYFMAHKRKKDAIQVRDSRRQTESFIGWLDEKLKLIDAIFSNELRDIIVGKSWEEIRIDFHGYK